MKALTALAIVTAIGLGVVVYMQNTEINTLKKQSASSSPMEERASDGVKSPSGTVVVEKNIKFDGSEINLQYRCAGEIKKGVERVGDPAEDVSFCVGDYSLVAKVGDQSTMIASGHAISGNDSPVFLGAEAVGDQGNIFISYKPSCASTGDCGAGMATNDVTYVFHSKDASVQPIANFPPNGKPLWNAIFTKALFIPETCGGAGCDLAPIIGYDLVKDSPKDVTVEKGVGLGQDSTASDATDPVGDRLPVWKSVEWIAGDTFNATLIKVDGTLKQVKGTF